MHTAVNDDRANFPRAMLHPPVHDAHMNERSIDTAWFNRMMRTMGVTQDDIANRIGRDRAQVSRMLHGRTEISGECAMALSELLGVPLLEVLKRAGWRIPPQPPALDRERLRRAMELTERVIRLAGLSRVGLETRLDILEMAYVADADTPDAVLERDSLLLLLQCKEADDPDASEHGAHNIPG